MWIHVCDVGSAKVKYLISFYFCSSKFFMFSHKSYVLDISESCLTKRIQTSAIKYFLKKWYQIFFFFHSSSSPWIYSVSIHQFRYLMLLQKQCSVQSPNTNLNEKNLCKILQKNKKYSQNHSNFICKYSIILLEKPLQQHIGSL